MSIKDPETSDDTGGTSPHIITVDQSDVNLIKIDHPELVYSITFLAGGGLKQRQFDDVYDLVVSRDGKWVVARTGSGQVVVWDSASFEKAIRHSMRTRRGGDCDGCLS